MGSQDGSSSPRGEGERPAAASLTPSRTPSRATSRGSSEDKPNTVPSFVGSRKSSAKFSSAKGSRTASQSPNASPPPATPEEPQGHKVNIILTCAVAYPKPSDETSRILEEMIRRNKKTFEAPRPTNFFHCDYTIAPSHESTTTDVVAYAVAAKVFTENDSRVVRTWDDGKNVWVAWMHSHELIVNSENVISLYNHTIDLRLWDGKDKVSSRARTDRPKAFRLPSGAEAATFGRGVQSVVGKQSKNWINLQPRESVTNNSKRSTKVEITVEKIDENEDTMTAAAETKENIENSDKKERGPVRVRSSLGRLAGINPSDEEHKRLNELKKQQSLLQKQLLKNAALRKAEEGSPVTPKPAVDKPKPTSCNKPVGIPIKLECLFQPGMMTTTHRLNDPMGSICDAFVTVSLDGPLLPDELEKDLNPLVLKTQAVKDLPNTPHSYEKLAEQCEQVHCRYSFLNHRFHRTLGRPHGKHVYFEDTHVILLGRMNEGELREYILNDAFHVEIHDRDLKPEVESGAPALFGEEANDANLASIGIVSNKRTAHNPFTAKSKPFHHHGVAKVSLLELLRGQTSINLQAAVTPCPQPGMFHDNPDAEGNIRLVGIPGEVDRPVRPPLPPGHYIQAGTTLKMKISVKHPLVPPQNVPRLLPEPQQVCPFSRVIFHFGFDNKSLIKEIEDFVHLHNAACLDLGHFERNVIDAALSTYKLSPEQKASTELDIITGFHVMDGETHIVVVEGLKDNGIPKFLSQVRRPTDDPSFVGMYDSSLSFSSRLYSSLDVDLCRVRLHQPISVIIKQPLIYVRDVIPQPCFDAVLKFQQMLLKHRLRDVTQSNLFPTADMVLSLSREFGVAITFDDLNTLPEPNKEASIAEKTESSEEVISSHKDYGDRRWTPLDNTNTPYDEMLRTRKERKSHDIDYVAANIAVLENAPKRPPSRLYVTADVEVAHNYSSQKLNSVELAKEKLRDMLKEIDQNARFTYHPSYNSSMVTPVNVEAVRREEDTTNKKRWRTDNGFVYPGVKSSTECNAHPLRPDTSRVEELKLAFKDNILHRNLLKPSLKRETTKWDERKTHPDLYKKPEEFFGSKPPVTIHLAGQLKEQESLIQKKKEDELWESRVVVDDPKMKFFRVLPATEDSNSSNQVDRLGEILKDSPKKISLRRKQAPVIPPLHVVLNPSVDTALRKKGVKLPPAYDESREKNVGFLPGPYDNGSWTLERNKIPIRDPQHEYFTLKHGADFNPYHTERKFLSARVPITDLKDEEKKNHLFRIPPADGSKEEPEKPKTPPKQYGLGPDGNSEYRYKFSKYQVVPRIHEIYPRHTFQGFAPVDDASVHVMDQGAGAIGGQSNKLTTEAIRAHHQQKNTEEKKDNSIEIVPSNSVPIATN